MSPTLPMTIVKIPMTKENWNTMNNLLILIISTYLDIVLVHHCGLHLLRIKAAVLVCVVVSGEAGGVVFQRLMETGAGTEVTTVTNDTTEGNKKQFSLRKVSQQRILVTRSHFSFPDLVIGETPAGFSSCYKVQQNCFNSFQT